MKKNAPDLVHTLRSVAILNSTKNRKTMTNKNYFAGRICVATLALCTPLTAQTPSKSGDVKPEKSETASSAPSPAKESTQPLPFHGMISAVDQNAKTFAIAGKKQSRVFKVTDKTSITKAGKTASMKDITENEEASGSYWKNTDGTLEAKMVKLGPMGKTKTSAPSPAASPKASPSPKP